MPHVGVLKYMALPLYSFSSAPYSCTTARTPDYNEKFNRAAYIWLVALSAHLAAAILRE
jgi:hypothetical protein